MGHGGCSLLARLRKSFAAKSRVGRASTNEAIPLDPPVILKPGWLVDEPGMKVSDKNTVDNHQSFRDVEPSYHPIKPKSLHVLYGRARSKTFQSIIFTSVWLIYCCILVPYLLHSEKATKLSPATKDCVLVTCPKIGRSSGCQGIDELGLCMYFQPTSARRQVK